MSRSLNILSLPDELISVILENTDYNTLIACRKSCHRLKDIIDSSSALTYAIELGATGMCDGTPNSVGPAERLKRLQNSQTIWKNSVWSQPDQFPCTELKGMSSYPTAVSGNLMVFQSTIMVADSIMLLLLRFPSELRGIPERQWYLRLEFAHIECVSADDSQDLLVFSSLPNIHVRTLSTGEGHPLTSTPGFIHLSEISVQSGISSLRTYDDFLACSIRGPEFHILVLNWKTGEQIAKIPHLPYVDFSFLDRTKIVFPYPVYDLELPRVVYLRVMTFPDTPDDSPLRSYDFVVDIPTLGGYNSYQIEFLCVNTLPSNRSDSSFPGLFHADPRNRLLALKIKTVDPPWSMFRALYVTHATLSSYIATHPSDADTVSVPWEVWGPGNAQMVDTPNATGNEFFHLTITCGMHALINSLGVRDRKKLHIMDCHPGRIARFLATHDAHIPCTETGEGSRHSNVTAVQRLNIGTLSYADIRYAPKDIPLPDGLQSESIECVLGEDVVALLEFSLDMEYRRTLESIFYHPI